MLASTACQDFAKFKKDKLKEDLLNQKNILKMI